MSEGQWLTRIGVLSLALTAFLAVDIKLMAQGIYVSGVGPVNRSMGGAGTAAPLDAIGALNWNPGSISALSNNELGVGIELLKVDIDLNSNIGPGTSGDAGFAAIPSIGWVHHVDGTPMTVGLGLFAVAGFKNNQPSGNALFNPAMPANAPPAFAKAEFLQVVPTLSYALSESVAVGLSPTVTVGELGFDPLGPSILTPVPATGQGNRSHWGGGFQAGVYYDGGNDVQLGFTFKSPQWMEQFEFYTSPTAVPGGVVKFELDLPMILSLGLGYTGICDWTFAADLRYFAYEDADGFSQLGFRNIFAAAFGAQRRVNDSLAIRFGVNFNEGPIQSEDVAANILSPLIQSYNLSVGATYKLTPCVDVNVAYVYLGHTAVSGPAGPATITHDIEAHSGIAGINVRY